MAILQPWNFVFAMDFVVYVVTRGVFVSHAKVLEKSRGPVVRALVPVVAVCRVVASPVRVPVLLRAGTARAVLKDQHTLPGQLLQAIRVGEFGPVPVPDNARP